MVIASELAPQVIFGIAQHQESAAAPPSTYHHPRHPPLSSRMPPCTYLVVESKLALQIILSVAQHEGGGAGERHALLPRSLLSPGDVPQLVVDDVDVVNRGALGGDSWRPVIIVTFIVIRTAAGGSGGAAAARRPLLLRCQGRCQLLRGAARRADAYACIERGAVPPECSGPLQGTRACKVGEAIEWAACGVGSRACTRLVAHVVSRRVLLIL